MPHDPLFKPMLAATLKRDDQLKFPYLVSPKFDGIRAIVIDGRVYSRNLKLIRNEHVQNVLGQPRFNGLDGELVVGEPTEPGCFGRTTSGIMSKAGQPAFRFYAFDHTAPVSRSATETPFFRRLDLAAKVVSAYSQKRGASGSILHVEHTVVADLAALEMYEDMALVRGYEGVMLRSHDGFYKYGRATEDENTLWKLKRFTDGEARVTDILEASHNTNEAKKDELGRSKRSSAKEGKVAAGMVGTIMATDLVSGLQLRVGPGTMTAVERKHYWKNQNELKGRIIKYRVFTYGAKDLPRFPTYQGIRDADDL